VIPPAAERIVDDEARAEGKGSVAERRARSSATHTPTTTLACPSRCMKRA
jgi:hypothetical protein